MTGQGNDAAGAWPSRLRDLLAPLRLDRPPTGSLASRGVVSIVGLAAQGLTRLLVAVLVGRVGGPVVLGVVAAGMATAQFLILLGPTTSGQAASRFLAGARGRRDGAELAHVAGHLQRRAGQASAVLAVLVVPVSWWRGVAPDQAIWISLFLLGIAGQQFTRGVHYGMNAVSRVVALDVTASVLGLLGVAAALAMGVRSLALLAPLAAAYLVLTWLCLPRGAHGSGTPPALRREIDLFVAFGTAGTVASAGLVQLSVLVADRLGTQAAGHYAAASTLAVPLTLLSGALSLVLYPSMAEAFGRGDEDAVRRQLDRGVRGLVVLMVPVAATLVLPAPEIVRLVYGPEFGPSAPVLAALLLAVVVSMVGVPCVNALTSGGRRGIRWVAALSVAALVAAVIVWTVLLPAGGLLAVAAGYATGVSVIAVVAFGVCWLRFRPEWVGVAVSIVVGLGAVGAGAACAAQAPLGVRVALLAGFVLVWTLTHPSDVRWWVGLLRR